jgi:hypothetical protein
MSPKTSSLERTELDQSFADDQWTERQRKAVEALLDLSSKASSGSGGQTWTRDEIHDRTEKSDPQ